MLLILSKTSSGQPNKTPRSDKPILDTPLERFKNSMVIDFEKWHDGIGYDLEAIKSASPPEREEIEHLLINHSPRGWRDIEALAEINTKSARQAIKEAIKEPDPAVRVAITRYAPDLVTDRERTLSIVNGLHEADIFGGLSQVLDDVAEYHPQEVKEALIVGLLKREGDVAVLFAAMLFYIFGKSKEPFDMAQRPFFLRFNTVNRAERVAVFRELCEKLVIDPQKYIG
jgi:hypothetical protein